MRSFAMPHLEHLEACLLRKCTTIACNEHGCHVLCNALAVFGRELVAELFGGQTFCTNWYIDVKRKAR